MRLASLITFLRFHPRRNQHIQGHVYLLLPCLDRCCCRQFTNDHLDLITRLFGKVDLGAVKLGLEVVDVCTEKDEGNCEDANEDGRSLALGGGALNDDTILADNLDTLDVVACVLVGVKEVRVIKLGLALSCLGVDLLPSLLDLIGILIVIVVVLVLLLVLLGGNTVHVNEGLGGVGKGVATGHLVVELSVAGTLTVLVVGEVGAELISEDTEEDLAALVGAVGANEVLNLLLELTAVGVVVVIVVVLVVVVGVLVNVPLSALHGLLDLDLLVLVPVITIVLLVRVLFDTVLHAGIHEAVVLAVLLVVGVLAVAGVLSVDLAVLELVLPVVLEEDVHVDDVITVARVAAAGILVGAGLGGTKAEADEALGLDEGIILAVGLLVPLVDVVAALELDGVVGNPAEVNLLILVLVLVVVVVVLVVVKTTGLGEDALSKLGAGLDGTGGDVLARRGGGSHGDGGDKSGKSELHFCSCPSQYIIES
mmetsp:Transcript_528/g.776  ORF Transcript_528/g.776 Transcript_528/m.776 type:complete len:481 (+) Transcript_528:129-1571(+)